MGIILLFNQHKHVCRIEGEKIKLLEEYSRSESIYGGIETVTISSRDHASDQMLWSKMHKVVFTQLKIFGMQDCAGRFKYGF